MAQLIAMLHAIGEFVGSSLFSMLLLTVHTHGEIILVLWVDILFLMEIQRIFWELEGWWIRENTVVHQKKV